MNCYYHPDKPAVAMCPQCGMGLCQDCVANAAYAWDNHPLCHDCSLKAATEELSAAKSQKVWSLVKFLFASFFLLLGFVIYSSTGDIMNAWIPAGIAGIPSAFRSTRDSHREKVRKGVRDALTTDVVDTSFNFFTDILVKLLLIIFLAPITATFFAIKHLFLFIGSFSKVKRAQESYDRLYAGDDIVGYGEASQLQPAFDAPAALPEGQRETLSSNQQITESADVIQSQQVFGAVASSPTLQGGQSVVSNPYSSTGTGYTAPAKKTNTGLIVGIVVGLLVLIGGVAGYFVWYVPYAKDRDALRTYVMATNVFLRSSEMAGVEYNVLGKIPYGSELITYEKGEEWAHVKVNGTEGYMASSYLLEGADFTLLNSVWGDMDSRDCIESSKCRMAILDFYKQNKLTGGSSGWQIYTKTKNQKPNTVFYPRIYDKGSKFTDFFFVIKNNASGQRTLVGYSFEDETEKPIYRFMIEAPEDGYIQKVYSRGGNVVVQFDNYQNVTVPLYR